MNFQKKSLFLIEMLNKISKRANLITACTVIATLTILSLLFTPLPTVSRLPVTTMGKISRISFKALSSGTSLYKSQPNLQNVSFVYDLDSLAGYNIFKVENGAEDQLLLAFLFINVTDFSNITKLELFFSNLSASQVVIDKNVLLAQDSPIIRLSGHEGVDVRLYLEATSRGKVIVFIDLLVMPVFTIDHQGEERRSVCLTILFH